MKKIALALCFIPSLCFADPIFVTAFLVMEFELAYATALFIASNLVAIASVTLTVYGTISARRAASRTAAAAKAAYNASLTDRMVSVLRADPPLQTIYGRSIVGGAIVDIFATDKSAILEDGSTYTRTSALKHIVVVLAAHECQAINEIYLEGVAVGALDSNGFPTFGEFLLTRSSSRFATFTGSITLTETPITVLGAYSTTGSGIEVTQVSQIVTISGMTLNGPAGVAVTCNYTVSPTQATVRIQKMLGSATQTTNSYLSSVAPTRYTANHRLRGLCYIVVTLDLEESRWQGGPPNITADVSGKKILDTRTSATAWSDNPALCVRDYITSVGGLGAQAADVDATYCSNAATDCDASITLIIDATSTTGKKYTCNGAISSDQSPETVLQDLAESMAGTIVYSSQWQINAGAWDAPVMALTDADLNGNIEVAQSDTPTDELINGIRGQLALAGAMSASDFNPYQNAAFLASDGKELWTNINLPYTNDLARARNLCRIFVERSRAGQVITFPARLRAWVLQIGDRVTVTSAEYGLSAKTYRVTDWQFGVSSAVILTLQEDSASIYDLADAAVADPTQNTLLPNPWAVQAVSALTASSGTANAVRRADGSIIPRVLITWAAITDAQVIEGGALELRWRRNAESAWRRIAVPSPRDTQAWITDASENDRIVIRICAINKFQATGSASIISHTVSGKSSEPANVAGLAGTAGGAQIVWAWTACPDSDYAATELRTGASWAAGAVVFRGKANTWAQTISTAGSYTLRAKHIDTSRNYSLTETAATVTATAGNLIPIGTVSGGIYLSSNATTGGATCVSGIQIKSTGAVARKASGTSSTYTDVGGWYNPVSGTPGSSYWVRLLQQSLSAGTLAGTSSITWLALSSSRTVTLTATSGVVASALVIWQIASDSLGATIVASGSIELNAESAL